MSKDKSNQEDRAKMSGIGAAHSGQVFAPVWTRDEPLSNGSDIEFALAKVGLDGEPTPLFNPVDLFDILDVAQSLAQRLSGSPLVESEVGASLGRLSVDLAALMQRHIRPAMAKPCKIRQTPSLKVVISPQH